MSIKHRFLEREIHPLTEIIILGTFNPDTKENSADFFYSRRQNYLWRILPLVFGEPDLKGKSPQEKNAFILRHRIGFLDTIAEIKSHPGDYKDESIDNEVIQWRDVLSEIKKLKKLRKVASSRKTFSGVPNIKKRLAEVEKWCNENGVEYKNLITPARTFSDAKVEEWKWLLK